MRIRRFVPLSFLLLLAVAPAVLAQTASVPDVPFYTRTVHIPAGESVSVPDTLPRTACDPPGTRYEVVVRNGNPGETEKVETGITEIDGFDYAGDALFDGASLFVLDTYEFQTMETVRVGGTAPADHPAVLTMEIWRKPITHTRFSQTYTFPQSTTNKQYTASFAAVPGDRAALIISRKGGLQPADQFTLRLNGNSYVKTKAFFTTTDQTRVYHVNLNAANTIDISAIAASQPSEVTVKVVQHAEDLAAPSIAFSGTIPAAIDTNTFTFNGTVTEANGIASLKVNGADVSVSPTGAFTSTVTLPQGVSTDFTFVAYDCAGHGTQAVKTLLSDLDPPAVTVTTPLPNAFVKGAVAVTGSVTDDVAGSASVKVNGTAATVTGNAWSATIALPAPDGAKSITAVATDLLLRSSSVTVPVTLDTTAPSISGAVAPAPPAGGWNRAGATVSFTCTDAGSGIATCTAPQSIAASGTYNVTGTATDQAGNQATTTVTVNVDADPPAATLDPASPVVNQSSFTLAGTVSDAHSGVLGVKCGAADATLSGARFSCGVSLLPGSNVLTAVATDRAGNTHQAAVDVQLDERAPLLEITGPPDGTIVNGTQVTVNGIASDNDEVAAIRVNGTSVAVSDSGEFAHRLTLTPGDNAISVEARDRGGNLTTRAITVNRYIVPVVTIASPGDLAVLRDTTVTIAGTVTDPAAAVTVNDIAASVSSNGNFTATGVPLQQGRTVITANAVSPSGGTATTSINLYRDSIPPRLEVYSPENDATVYASPVSISGMVDDIVVGTINSQQMRVNVNGLDAEVANRAFLRRDVPLSPGLNTFSITATDEGGNTTVVSYRLTYVPAPPQPHLEIVSGNGQSGVIGTALAAPLAVRAVAPDGSPIAGAALTFEMDSNDGTVSDGTTTASKVTVVTDAQGRAQAQWTLGNRAGAGNHRVRIHATGYAAPLEATAAATTGAPELIVVDTGNNQFGIAGDALPRPLIAIVVDAGNNRLAGVPVTFTVSSGGGSFDGQPSILAATDSDGRAIVRPTLGPDPGEDNNVFSAAAPGVTASATFVASGRAAGPPASTRITGVIMDNTSLPLAGVSVRIDGTQLYTQTDANGQFTIAGAPVGYVKLFIDGSTTQRPGTWPTLEYALYTLPGVENSVGSPIYLVQLDTARGLFVDDTTGGTLTLPELPGFALEVKAGSATFPGGGRTGTVSATLVHADRIPMAPGFGQQPKFIITIQPPGTHFDPPARLTLPNTDGLTPGASTEMYSFDHDLGQFVTIGSATVSADGSVITSDPGTGIIKGGWHAGGDPTPGGGGSDCGPCQKAVRDMCVADELLEGGAGPDDNVPGTIDLCLLGQPRNVVPRLQVEVTSQDNFLISVEPRMPRIQARVRVFADGRELDASQFQFNWEVSIRYDPWLDRVPDQHVVTTVINPHLFDYILNMWRGGVMRFTAKLMRPGQSGEMVPTVSASWPPQGADPVSIQGTNPGAGPVFAQVDATAGQFADKYRLILCEETRQHGFPLQFIPDTGLPVLGDDDNNVTWGVGMSQLTPLPSEPPVPRNLYWNWAMNLAGGIDKFREKHADAVRYVANMRRRYPNVTVPDLTPEQLEIEALQRYNSGVYHRFTPARGWYGDDPHNGYADRVMRVGCP